MRTDWQWPQGRGEGIIGEKGEGFAGTILKDTWTITREGGNRGGSWGGLGCWGGVGKKAENCTWTTIKNVKKICLQKKEKHTKIGNMQICLFEMPSIWHINYEDKVLVLNNLHRNFSLLCGNQNAVIFATVTGSQTLQFLIENLKEQIMK